MPLTVHQMREMIARLEQAEQESVEIPQRYTDRLSKSAELLKQIQSLKPIQWDQISTTEQIEEADRQNHLRLELLNEIEQHLKTCGLSVESKRVRRAAGERMRQPRRSRERVEYDRQIAEITRNKKAELALQARGRLTEEQQAKLDKEVEKELRKQKIAPPKA